MLTKKQIRENFRNVCLKRDDNCCRVCKSKGPLDVHHIYDRNLLPNGGYVKSNGICLCQICHIIVEEYHQFGSSREGFHPDDLYKLIGSSYKQAYKDSLKLK